MPALGSLWPHDTVSALAYSTRLETVPEAIRMLRVKEPSATPLANRNSATRRASRLVAQSDAGKSWPRLDKRS